MEMELRVAELEKFARRMERCMLDMGEMIVTHRLIMSALTHSFGPHDSGIGQFISELLRGQADRLKSTGDFATAAKEFHLFFEALAQIQALEPWPPKAEGAL
jgi:hypothetical protein